MIQKKIKKLQPNSKTVDTKKFRFANNQILLTYPNLNEHNQLKPFFEFLKEQFSKYELKYLLCARELHEDGRPHFHAYASFHKRIDSKNPRFCDYLGNHPNIQKPYSPDAWVSYIKEDGDYLEEGTFHTKEEIRCHKNAQKNNTLLSKSIQECVENGHISILQLALLAKAKEIYEGERKKDIFARKSIRPDYEFSFQLQPLTSHQFLQISKIKFNLAWGDKRRHYYIVGQVNSGKSTFLNKLISEESAIRASYFRNWTTWKPGCRLVICDEYDGQMEWTEINTLCDGAGQLNIKGSNVDCDEQKPIIMFIGSNRTPEELFTRTNATPITQDAFHARFNVIRLFNSKPTFTNPPGYNSNAFGLIN